MWRSFVPLENAPTQSCVSDALPISPAVWDRLVEANQRAVLAGWAADGVFATGIGSKYERGGNASLLYIGKSAGPKGALVGSCSDQARSGFASSQWMFNRENKGSPFWQFLEKIDEKRQRTAWTNICKMNREGGERPLAASEWSQISDACMAALGNEIAWLLPQVAVFTTSGIYQTNIDTLLSSLGYTKMTLDFSDGWTFCHRSAEGRYAIETRHPQGWNRVPRDRVINLIVRLLSERNACPP
jgi:hypothetical protein